MTNNSAVCPDTSVLVKLVLAEEGSDAARALWGDWAGTGAVPVVPHIARYECVSVVWQLQRKGFLGPLEAIEALGELLALPVTVIGPEGLHLDAYRLSVLYDLPSSYDAHYLALAQALDCEFWTADRRLFNTVAGQFPLIRLLGAA